MDDDLDDALPDDRAKVFLSYSRKDRARAQGIAEALRARHFGVFRDTDDILPTEEWRGRLEQLITEADTIVFLLSPHSAASEICGWEVDLATRLNKRIAPIVIEETPGEAIPPKLARLNFIFATPRDPFENAVDTLVSALNLDIEWIREHTRLTGLATRWEKAGRPGRFLLRGQDIRDAETWRDGRPSEAPAVTSAQAALIADSRAAAGRRQRTMIAGSLAAAAFALVLAVFAYLQSVEADQQRARAEDNAAEANTQRAAAELSAAEAERQRAIAEQNAAEAERQRIIAEQNAAEAERQRDIVARRLISQNLRAGDFAGAADLMRRLDPDSADLRVLLSTLAGPEDVSFRDVPGTPFFLNGGLYLSRRGAPPLPIEAAFPATRWSPAGEGALLVSDTGAALLLGPDAVPVAERLDPQRETPCIAHRGNGETSLLSFFANGYSACSVGLSVTTFPDGGGPVRNRRLGSCDGVPLDLEGPNGTVEANLDDLIGYCSPGAPNPEFQANPQETHPDFRALGPLLSQVYPGPAPEDRAWRPTKSEKRMFSEYVQGALQSFRLRALRDLNQFYGGEDGPDSVPGYLYPREIRRKNAELDTFVQAILTIQDHGGTGGENYVACMQLIATDRRQVCHEIWTPGGMRGLALSDDGLRSVVFGRDLAVGPSSTGLVAMSLGGDIHALDLSEEVLAADFGPDGRLAVLTTSQILIYPPDLRAPGAGAPTVLRRPLDARTLVWRGSGEIILLGTDGVYRGGDTGDWRRIPLPAPPETPLPNGRPPHYWLSQNDFPIIALGYGRDVVLYSLDYDAPLTRPYTLPFEAPGVGLANAVFYQVRSMPATFDTGAGQFQRMLKAPEEIEALFDPEAPLR